MECQLWAASSYNGGPARLHIGRTWETIGENIRVLRVVPGKAPEIVAISNTLEAIQQAVGGYIEVIPLRDVCLVCNEGGKLMGLPGGHRLGGGIIVDIFFPAGDTSDGHPCSLIQEQAGRWGQHLAQPEAFRPDEVEKKIHIKFCTVQAIVLQPTGVDTDISSADAGAGYNYE